MNPGPNKVCPQCHQLVAIDAQHCPYCGHAFRTQFVQPQPQYPPPNQGYGPTPMGAPYYGQPYPQHQNKQPFVKWLIGLTIAAILGVAAFSVFKMKLAPASGSSANATKPIIPTDVFDDSAAQSVGKILIHWEKSGNGQTMAEVTNEGSQVLPNLYLQFVLSDDPNAEYSDPYQIKYGLPGDVPQSQIPPNQPIPFTVPVDFNDIKRLHAYFVEDTPAGSIQYALTIDQTQDQGQQQTQDQSN